MASPSQWTWVWAGSGSWWWTGKPVHGLQSQTRLSDWTELTDRKCSLWHSIYLIIFSRLYGSSVFSWNFNGLFRKFQVYRTFLTKINIFGTVLHQKKFLWKCESLSLVQIFVTLGTVAHQAPLSMAFSRQEHWSGLPFPSPGDLPDPRIKPWSPALQADSLLSEPPCRTPPPAPSRGSSYLL